jgi:hypothetical protein
MNIFVRDLKLLWQIDALKSSWLVSHIKVGFRNHFDGG